MTEGSHTGIGNFDPSAMAEHIAAETGQPADTVTVQQALDEINNAANQANNDDDARAGAGAGDGGNGDASSSEEADRYGDW